MSSKADLKFGVSQRSVLGPLLFTRYTSPLSSMISGHTIPHYLYADDSQLYVFFASGNSTAALNGLQACLASVQSWMLTNKVKLNPDKTIFLLIGMNDSGANTSLLGQAIDLWPERWTCNRKKWVQFRLVPLSKALYHTCFSCGRGSKWWSRDHVSRNRLSQWFPTLNLPFTFTLMSAIEVFGVKTNPAISARNLGVIFHKHSSRCSHISAVCISGICGVQSPWSG